MERENIPGMMVLCITAIGMRTKSMGLVSTLGLTADVMKASGKKTICMVREAIPGKMEGSMKGIIRTIESKATVSTLGLMEDSIWVIGTMENSMDKVLIGRLMAKLEKAFGKMVGG